MGGTGPGNKLLAYISKPSPPNVQIKSGKVISSSFTVISVSKYNASLPYPIVGFISYNCICLSSSTP